ncbi:MAG TPA: FAD-dependent oxidoreductase [Steroidobacteraceae bacterium]|nr:FAD-dependent oxidoreductase [Steroidobacteraceae bacterium]
MSAQRYAILLEPVRIGPLTARNRFYQVPHCNGMGYRDPSAAAAMRGVKAEGGWAVVCTEQVEVHYSSDITPFIELRLWDDRDIPALARVAEEIHRHGSLAGIELAYNGMNAPNLYSREVPMGPAHLPIATFTHEPLQARRMDRADIRNVRRWHLEAVRRARQAGFDLIYVYAAHGLGFLHHFLSRRLNDRTDEYGGSLENRSRLLREITEETKAAVGHVCAVPIRISVDELRGSAGLNRAEVEDMIGSMADLPDLWDVTLAGWENDSRTSRFAEEGHQEEFIRGIKRLTARPVVGVGRYTSVDRMVRLVREGILDLIGAARPSIADPFLPRKIAEGRIEDIRECIGCNICVAGDFTQSPLRCTQNPTMGEEWRRGWHPERVRPRGSERPVLVVGAGPAGLEAALVLGQRGYPVTLAEATGELGGRVLAESRLPGLSAWIRVRDYRAGQLAKLANVEVYLRNRLSASEVLGLAIPRIVIATGARWRSDGVGRFHTHPIPIAPEAQVLSPSDVLAGRLPRGKRVLVWDDDHYYLGGVLAELFARGGYETSYLTPAAEVSTWTRATLEQHFIQERLLRAGVRIHPHLAVAAVAAEGVETVCVFTGKPALHPADAVVLVTARLPADELASELRARSDEWADAGIESVAAIGDALAPGTIAHATYAGRRYAEELDHARPDDAAPPFRRELTQLSGS